MNFSFDRIDITPNLSGDRTDIFSAPYVGYPKLLDYLHDHTIPVTYSKNGSGIYLIHIFYFDFNYDIFVHLQDPVIQQLQNSNLKLVIMYGEPDNPYHINDALTAMCKRHNIPREAVTFVSGNTIADTIPNMVYFNEDLCAYKHQWRNKPLLQCDNTKKNNKFTLLSRTVKDWRTLFIFNLWREGHLDQSYVSHGQVNNLDGSNDRVITLTDSVQEPNDAFNKVQPLTADSLTSAEHNDHSKLVVRHYTDSYFNIVLETFLSVEDTKGVFLSEKTWKPILNGQMFIIMGCAHSLKHLHEYGFKTFSDIIDESYDTLEDDNERFNAVLNLVRSLAALSLDEMHNLYMQALPIIKHNQQRFNDIQPTVLKKLLGSLESH